MPVRLRTNDHGLLIRGRGSFGYLGDKMMKFWRAEVPGITDRMQQMELWWLPERQGSILPPAGGCFG